MAEQRMGMQQNAAMNEKVTDAGRGFVCSLNTRVDGVAVEE